MIYQYECKFGHGPFDIYKPVSRATINESCPECCSEMRKLLSRAMISFGTFKAGFYSAFGKTLNTKAELKNELSRIKHDTGKEIVEVGNDKRFPGKILPGFPVEEAKRELRAKWRR